MGSSKSILVAGNGYDLANRLHTKYSDFMEGVLYRYISNYLYRAYCPELAKDSISSEFRELLDIFEMKIKQIETLNILDKKFNKSFFKNQFIQILIHKYFPLVSVFKAYTKALVKVNSKAEDKNVPFNINIYNEIKKKCKEIIRSLCNKDHMETQLCLDLRWMDVENVISEIVRGEVISELYKVLSKDDVESFYQLFEKDPEFNDANEQILFCKPDLTDLDLVECKQGLEMFSTAFVAYLKSECKNYKPSDEHENFALEQKFDYLISLNYTPICRYSLKDNSDEYCCFIHGNINDRNIVMGTGSFSYNNSIDDIKMNTTPFYKFFQRILYKTDEKYHEWINSSAHFTLTFFGFSFGKNDHDFIKELIVESRGNTKIKSEKIRENLDRINIYYLKPSDLYEIIRNLTTFLGKDLIIELKPKLDYHIINDN